MSNKMRHFLFLLLFVFIFSCKHSEDKVIIKGKFHAKEGASVFLQEITSTNDGITDSMVLGSNGNFEFKKEITYPTFYRLWTSLGNQQITLVVHPGEKVKIEGEASRLLNSYSVSGSDDSELAKDLTQTLNKTITKSDSLNQLFLGFKNNPNINNIKQILTQNYNDLIENQRKFNISFIEKHPGSVVSILALYQQVSQNTWILYKEEDLKYFEKVDAEVYKKYPTSPFVNMLHGNVQEMKAQQQQVKMQQMISSMGKKAPEIILPSYEGDSVRLSGLSGKCVLVYFWASWNKNSRLGIAELKAIYRKYKLKGFEIFQVSLDKSKEAWISAIREDGSWWLHGCDLRYWDSPVAETYNITSLPASFLLDKEGVIVGRDMMGESLEIKIQEILGTKKNTTN